MVPVTVVLGVTLFLLLVSVLAMITRIKLLMRKMDAILAVFRDSDQKMEAAVQSVMGETAASDLKVPRRSG